MGRLFPSETELQNLLKLINDLEIAPLWAEDETIGWIYQYFNSKEERKKMRDESAAPRNSRELAVRNQFFTPRYVVEFLTDNTLGRVWYEMTQGETALKETCRYLVRRPSEIFLEPGAVVPEQSGSEGDLSQADLLKQPVYIPHRRLKDPREIRMLDPACGSMHFGLYAFDLYERIYEEAWEIEEQQGATVVQRDRSLKPLTETYDSKEAFLRDVPRLIIEHNIHGIDIDPRAVQIAGLSLWLRAQKSWQVQELKRQNRPQIQKSNIVCAEPMPGEERLLNEFLEHHLSATPEQRLVGQLVRRVFEAMKLAGEAGSLLQIEQEVSKDIEAAKQQWLNRPKTEQLALLTIETNEPQQQELALQVGDITDERFWERVEDEIYKALNRYAEQAENGNSYQRRLFANDAVRGFAFIDICRKKFDVALMNPPFGELTISAIPYIQENFLEGKNDAYAAIIIRASHLLTDQGRIGTITSRAFTVGRDLRGFRKVLLRQENVTISLFLDLGLGILDGAMVETAAYILAHSTDRIILYKDVREAVKKSSLDNISLNSEWIYWSSQTFQNTQENQFLFQLDQSSIDSLTGTAKFSPEFADVTYGLITENDERFIRLRWEVPEFALNLRWVYLSKGGDYAWFNGDLHLVVNRKDNGAELASYAEQNSGNIARTRQSSKFYGKPGASYSRRSQKGFSSRRLRRGCCFSDKSGIVFPKSMTDDWTLVIPLLFSTTYYLNLIYAQSKFGSYEIGAIKQLPKPKDEWLSLAEYARSIYRRIDEIEQHIETAALFVNPFQEGTSIFSIWTQLLGDLRSFLKEKELDLCDEVEKYQLAIAEELDCLWNNSLSLISYALGCVLGRWDIRYSTGEKLIPELSEPVAPLPNCPPGMLQDQGQPITAKEVLNYSYQVVDSGILVDDEGHPDDIVNRVRNTLRIIWKEKDSDIEQKACEILKVSSLRDYFRKPTAFFNDHLSRYSKSRRQAPIYLPLSTRSGNYTLWLYYHRLTDQTLYTCINDYVEPKLNRVSETVSSLRNKTGRSRDEEKLLEDLQDLESELEDFRDALQRIAQFWKPNLNDGVQITLSPLWSLFRLGKWQKKLKETWDKLEKGDYDWAHLAHSIWAKRVEEKCKKDKSLAIAHNLEHLYETPPETPKSTKRKKKE